MYRNVFFVIYIYIYVKCIKCKENVTLPHIGIACVLFSYLYLCCFWGWGGVGGWLGSLDDTNNIKQNWLVPTRAWPYND